MGSRRHPTTPRIPDERRAEIAELIRAGVAAGKGRNDIAREHGIAPGTVSNIAREIGVTFDRGGQVAAATAAKQADNRRRRAVIIGRLYEKTEDFLDQLDEPHVVFAFGGRDNVYSEHQLERPPTGDIRNLMWSASTALQRAVDLERVDAGTDVDTAKSMLGGIAAALGTALRNDPEPEQ